MVIDVVRKTFYIGGYMLFYLLATLLAGVIGLAGAYVAEHWILDRFITADVKPNGDYIEISTWVFMLFCSASFLIVAVGLLSVNIVGVLPHEYDEPAIPVGIALFGLIVFVCLILGALLFACYVWHAVILVNGLWRVEALDEEAGLLRNSSRATYGTSKAFARQHETLETESLETESLEMDILETQEETTDPAIEEHTAPRSLDQIWIQMKVTSSVRNLDVRRTLRFPGRARADRSDDQD